MRISDWSSDVCSSDLLSDVVSGSAVGLRGRLWRLTAAELRSVAVSASAEILRLEAVRVAVVDELSLRPDDQVIASRGVGCWLAANTMLQVRDRSAEIRVGRECVSTGRSRWAAL